MQCGGLVDEFNKECSIFRTFQFKVVLNSEIFRSELKFWSEFTLQVLFYIDIKYLKKHIKKLSYARKIDVNGSNVYVYQLA